MKGSARLASIVLAVLLSGCGAGRHVQKGINAYKSMNYHQAMTIWHDIEPLQPEMNDKGRVRYLVFRGLTHYRLGDRQGATYFLTQGRQAYQMGDPSWIDPVSLGQMNQALADLSSSSSPAAPAGGVPAAPPAGTPDEEPVTIQ